MRFGNGQARVLHGKFKGQGNLHLWRADDANGAVIYGGEAQRRPKRR